MEIYTPTGKGLIIKSDEETVSVQYPDNSVRIWLWSECQTPLQSLFAQADEIGSKYA